MLRLRGTSCERTDQIGWNRLNGIEQVRAGGAVRGSPLSWLVLLLVIHPVGSVPAIAQVPWGPRPYAEKEVGQPASLDGRVVFLDPRPQPSQLEVVSDFACCDKSPKWSESLIVSEDGGLANAVVLLDGLTSGKPFPTRAVTVDQRECVFRPHVTLAFCDQKLRVVNSDPVLHNVHGYMIRGSYDIFNFAMTPQGGEVFQKLPAPGAILLKCDAGHRWMSAFIYAGDNPYMTLTGRDGRFRIEGIPPGRRQVKIWHESLGEAVVKVNFAPSATVEMTIESQLKEKPRLRFRRSGETARPRSPPPSTSPPPLAEPIPALLVPPESVPGSRSVRTAVPTPWASRDSSANVDEAPEADLLRTLAILALAGSVLVILLLALYRVRASGSRKEHDPSHHADPT